MQSFRRDRFTLTVGRQLDGKPDFKDFKKVAASQLQSTPQGILIIAPLLADTWDLGALFNWGSCAYVDLSPVHDGGPLEPVLHFQLQWKKVVWMPFDLTQIGTKARESAIDRVLLLDAEIVYKKLIDQKVVGDE